MLPKILFRCFALLCCDVGRNAAQNFVHMFFPCCALLCCAVLRASTYDGMLPNILFRCFAVLCCDIGRNAALNFVRMFCCAALCCAVLCCAVSLHVRRDTTQNLVQMCGELPRRTECCPKCYERSPVRCDRLPRKIYGSVGAGVNQCA